MLKIGGDDDDDDGVRSMGGGGPDPGPGPSPTTAGGQASHGGKFCCSFFKEKGFRSILLLALNWGGT